MKISYQIISIFIISIFHLSAQNIELVDDYRIGPEGSFNRYSAQFKGDLIYSGYGQNGEQAILQYNVETDKITTVLTNNDIEGEISYFYANTEKILLVTAEDGFAKNIYVGEESDLSDLTKVYDTGNSALTKFGLTDNNSVITIETDPATNFETAKFVLIDPNNNVIDLFEDLENDAFSHRVLLIDKYILITPFFSANNWDFETVKIYDTEAASFSSFDMIVPDYQECGFFKKIILGQELIYYECDEIVFYDVKNDMYLDPPSDLPSILYNKENHFFYVRDGDIIKRNKLTNEEELFIENSTNRSSNFEYGVSLSSNEDKLIIKNFNYETEEIYTYETDFTLVDLNNSLTRPVFNSNGIHFSLYSNTSEQGIICRMEKEEFNVVGNINKIPVAAKLFPLSEDIYFFQEDPTVGTELFKIDYISNSTIDEQKSETLSITPNPAYEFIELDHPGGWNPISLSIMDMYGNLVGSGIKQSKIGVGGLSSGVYLCNVLYANGEYLTSRFLVR